MSTTVLCSPLNAINNNSIAFGERRVCPMYDHSTLSPLAKCDRIIVIKFVTASHPNKSVSSHKSGSSILDDFDPVD